MTHFSSSSNNAASYPEQWNSSFQWIITEHFISFCTKTTWQKQFLYAYYLALFLQCAKEFQIVKNSSEFFTGLF